MGFIKFNSFNEIEYSYWVKFFYNESNAEYKQQ